MIELRYIYREGSDRGNLQYRVWNVFLSDGMALPLTKDNIRWSNWKFVPRIIVSREEYERMMKDSIGDG